MLAVWAFWVTTVANAQTTSGYSIAGVDGNSHLFFDESSGTVTVSVTRLGDFNIPGSVHYRLATNSANFEQLGSATAGVDFLPTEGTLTFGANETNQTFRITLIDDALIERGIAGSRQKPS